MQKKSQFVGQLMVNPVKINFFNICSGLIVTEIVL